MASAGPLTRDLETAKRLEDAGGGAIVLPSLFEEEIVHEEVELTSALEAGAEHFPEALDYFPRVPEIDSILDRYLTHDRRAQGRRSTIPVIASLNATAPGEWIRYAQLLATPAPTRIELNLYRLAADPERTRPRRSRTRDVRLVADVVAAVDVPAGRQAGPVLHGDGQLRAARSSRPARTASCSSTASTSPTSTSRPSTWCPGST